MRELYIWVKDFVITSLVKYKSKRYKPNYFLVKIYFLYISCLRIFKLILFILLLYFFARYKQMHFTCGYAYLVLLKSSLCNGIICNITWIKEKDFLLKENENNVILMFFNYYLRLMYFLNFFNFQKDQTSILVLI